MEKIEVLNKKEVDKIIREDGSVAPTVKFELKMTERLHITNNSSIGAIHGHFLSEAIDYIEALNIYDDYDDFVSESEISFHENDEETITYLVTVTLDVDN